MFGEKPTFSFTAVSNNGGLFGFTKPDEVKTESKPLFGGLNTIKPQSPKPVTNNLFGSGSNLWKPASGGEFGGQKLAATPTNGVSAGVKPKEPEGEKLF